LSRCPFQGSIIITTNSSNYDPDSLLPLFEGVIEQQMKDANVTFDGIELGIRLLLSTDTPADAAIGTDQVVEIFGFLLFFTSSFAELNLMVIARDKEIYSESSSDITVLQAVFEALNEVTGGTTAFGGVQVIEATNAPNSPVAPSTPAPITASAAPIVASTPAPVLASPVVASTLAPVLASPVVASNPAPVFASPIVAATTAPTGAPTGAPTRTLVVASVVAPVAAPTGAPTTMAPSTTDHPSTVPSSMPSYNSAAPTNM
jgi:hypothetical protein